MGNLSGWWSAADTKEFNRRAEVVQKQFDGYVAIDSLHVNGKLTLGTAHIAVRSKGNRSRRPSMG